MTDDEYVCKDENIRFILGLLAGKANDGVLLLLLKIHTVSKMAIASSLISKALAISSIQK